MGILNHPKDPQGPSSGGVGTFFWQGCFGVLKIGTLEGSGILKPFE